MRRTAKDKVESGEEQSDSEDDEDSGDEKGKEKDGKKKEKKSCKSEAFSSSAQGSCVESKPNHIWGSHQPSTSSSRNATLAARPLMSRLSLCLQEEV